MVMCGDGNRCNLGLMTVSRTNILTSTPIYHITCIENIEHIIRSGRLICTNQLNTGHACIANDDIQSRRAVQRVRIAPHGCLHDYVPFYFAPRSPMLYANKSGAHTNARKQEDIVYLVTTAQKAANARPFVFYDSHAIVAFAGCYNSLLDINKIDWELFFEPPLTGDYSTYWHDKQNGTNPKWINRKAVRQAEFLSYEYLNWKEIQYIATMNETRTNEVRDMLRTLNDNTPVLTRTDYYF